MVVVTHEINFALEVGDTVHFIDGGVVVEFGTPEQVIRHSTHARTTEFLARVRNAATEEI